MTGHRGHRDPVHRLLVWTAACYGLWATVYACLITGGYR